MDGAALQHQPESIPPTVAPHAELAVRVDTTMSNRSPNRVSISVSGSFLCMKMNECELAGGDQN